MGMIAADRFEYSCSCSTIIRTARARTSVKYLFAQLLFFIGSIFAYFGASGKEAAVNCRVTGGFYGPAGRVKISMLFGQAG